MQMRIFLGITYTGQGEQTEEDGSTCGFCHIHSGGKLRCQRRRKEILGIRQSALYLTIVKP